MASDLGYRCVLCGDIKNTPPSDHCLFFEIDTPYGSFFSYSHRQIGYRLSKRVESIRRYISERCPLRFYENPEIFIVPHSNFEDLANYLGADRENKKSSHIRGRIQC